MIKYIDLKCKDCQTVFEDEMGKEEYECPNCKSKNVNRFYGNQDTVSFFHGAGYTKSSTN